MSDVVFSPSSWMKCSQEVEEIRQGFQEVTQDILFPTPERTEYQSAVDRALCEGMLGLHPKWFNSIGNMVEKLNSDSSKMAATANNYQAAETSSEYVVRRYWSYK